MSEGALSGRRPQPMAVGDLRLVPWSVADASDLLAAIDGDEAVATYSISLRTVRDLPSARRWLAQRSEPGRVEWSLRAPDGGLVGRIALHDFDDWSAGAEVGYSVFPPFRRRGVASRVLEAVTTYGFRDLGLNRIMLQHEVANLASCGVAMRGGLPRGRDRARAPSSTWRAPGATRTSTPGWPPTPPGRSRSRSPRAGRA